MAKYYLDENGVRIFKQYVDEQLSHKVSPEELSNYATKEDLQHVTVDLTGYATQADVQTAIANIPAVEPYDDTEVKDAIETLTARTSGLYHYKGTVANLEALLAIENPAEGDTYNLADTGMNAAWNGNEWDEFGAVVDLSEYMKETDVLSITRAELAAILYSGKSAVVSDEDGIKAMLSNSQSEVTITLNSDLSLTTPIEIPAGKSVTLDLTNNELTSTGVAVQVNGGDVTLRGGNIESTGRPVWVQSGSLTIEGTDIVSDNDCAISASGVGSSVTINSGNIEAQEVPVLVTSGASAVVNGGHLVGRDNFAIGGNGTAGQGNINVTINGGIIEGHITSAGYAAAAIYWPNSGTLTINGGTIVSEGAGIVMRGGTVNINEGTVVQANGATGSAGKVGDARQVVGPYAIVYDKNSKYPAYETLELNIAEGVVLNGTDGDIQVIMPDGETADMANIHDNR